MIFMRALAIVSVLSAVYCLTVIFLIYINSNANNTHKADAVVVMGAGQWGGVPSPVLMARLNKALSIYNAGIASVIITTGGIGKGESVSEAQVAKSYLMDNGVGENVIFSEHVGKTTLQSLRAVKLIMSKENIATVTIVSDGSHIMRLRKMTNDLNIGAHFAAVRTGSVLTEFKSVMREVVVFLLYLIFRM